MKPTKVHCFFEQSGTFKNEFINLGIPAEDYDILNEFGETDHIMDLFKEIRDSRMGGGTVFDNISSDELIMAFFPCIRFEDQILLWFRGENYAQRGWSDIEKIEYDIRLQHELTELYELISWLTITCLERGIPLIIENPYSSQHYLTQRWCIEPKVIDEDRRERGDRYKKPTQYWFIGCSPSENFIWEPQIMWDEYLSVERAKHGAERSLMTHEYANRFIREFIL
jgi:hypothetical protein